MRHEEFVLLVDRYGSNWHRWPPRDRHAAQALLSRSAEAQTVWEEARRLDEILNRMPVEPASDALRASILSRIERTPQLTRDVPVVGRAGSFRGELARVAALAGVFVLGLAVGWSDAPFMPKPVVQVDVSDFLDHAALTEGW